MEKLNNEYIDLLSATYKKESDKFWALEKWINRGRRASWCDN